MFEFKHPKYYKELRKRNKTGVTATTKRDIGHSQELSFGFPPPVNSDQAISKEPATAGNQRSPGPGLKPQASSGKRQAPAGGKPQAASLEKQASSPEEQASSLKP